VVNVQFANYKYTDTHFACGLCDGNAWAVAEELAGIRLEFSSRFQWLPDIRSFTASTRKYSVEQHSYFAGGESEVLRAVSQMKPLKV